MTIYLKGRDSKGKECEFEAGFKFNNFAFEQYADLKNITTLSASTIAMMYCGYKGWCFAKQIDEKLCFEDFSDYVDMALDDENVRRNLKLISEEMVRSNHWKKVEENLKKNELLNEQKAA